MSCKSSDLAGFTLSPDSTQADSESASTGTGAFCGGSGTSSSPFLICSAASFRQIGQYPSAHFKLTGDISLSSSITPLSTFTGSFDGNGKSVSGLQFSNLGDGDSAWILVNNGIIKNTVFYNSSFYGYGLRTGLIARNNGTLFSLTVVAGASSGEYTSSLGMQGGLVADNYGTVENCRFQGTILYRNRVTVGGLVGVNRAPGLVLWSTVQANTSISRHTGTENLLVGGLVGENYGIIRNGGVSSSVSIQGGKTMGGIVALNETTGTVDGALFQGSLNLSIAYGNVGGIVGFNKGTVRKARSSPSASVAAASGASYASVGGVVGWNDSTGIISDSVSGASISAGGSTTTSSGGLVGDTKGYISTSYAYGPVQSGTYAGVFCGYKFSGASISSSFYYNTATPGTDTCAIAKTYSQLTSLATFSGWNFSTVWSMPSGDSPSLIWPTTYPY